MPFMDNEYEFDINLKKMYEILNPLRDLINLETNLEEGYKLLRKNSLKYNPEEFLKQKNYIIYILWKYTKDDKMYALYVGKSGMGLRRTFVQESNRYQLFENADELEVIPCIKKEISDQLEIKLIIFLSPTYNEQYKIPNKIERIISRDGI